MKMYKDGVGVEAMESQLEILMDAGWSLTDTPKAEAPKAEAPAVEVPAVEVPAVEVPAAPEKVAEPGTKRKLGK